MTAETDSMAAFRAWLERVILRSEFLAHKTRKTP